MIAKHAPRVLALLLAVTVATMTSEALAYCASCSAGSPATYSVGYAAPVAYTAAYAPTYTAAYAPTYTTAYAPAYTTYYGSTWAERRALRRSLWGYPTTSYYAPTYTAAYAPTYTTTYAPTTAYYAPTVAYAAPVSVGCSTCSACTASYAPACSTCGVSTVSYAAAPVACEACAAAGTTCSSCAVGNVSQAAFIESAPTTTAVTTSAEPQPTLAPTEQVPATRDVQKPVTAPPAEDTLQPEPRDESDTAPSTPTPSTTTTEETTTNLQAPQLLDPNDRTAAAEKPHGAPVWTAVLHQTSAAKPTTRSVSWSEEVQANADGWESASK